MMGLEEKYTKTIIVTVSRMCQKLEERLNHVNLKYERCKKLSQTSRDKIYKV